MKNEICNDTEILFLGYHYLKRNDEYKRIYGCSLDLFKKQIDFLAKEFPPVSFGQLTAFLQGEGGLPKRCSVLFFDDGLVEHANFFAPYLAKKNISALFAPPTCIFDGKMTNVQVIHFISARYGVERFYKELKKYFISTGLSWEDYFGSELEKMPLLLRYQKIKYILLYVLPVDARIKLLDTIYAEVLLKNDSNILEKVYMTKKDLSDIAVMGHDVGCHSYSHFSSLKPDFCKEEWKKEIEEPKKLLQSIIGQDVNVFIYPYGRKKKEDFNFVEWSSRFKRAGFRYVFNTYREFDGDAQFNPYWIEKYSVHSEDQPEDIIKNAHAYKLITQ